MKKMVLIAALAWTIIPMLAPAARAAAHAGVTHLAAVATQPAQVSSQPTAPLLPQEMNNRERTLLTEAGLDLSHGQFDTAISEFKRLSIPATTRVFLDLSALRGSTRDAWKAAVLAALQSWDQALNGSTRFVLVGSAEEADVVILFDRDVAQVDSGQARLMDTDTRLIGLSPDSPNAADHRTAEIHLSINVPYSSDLHSAASVTHNAAQGIGRFLGLLTSDTGGDTGVMGPDTHGEHVAVKPSAAEAQLARDLQSMRARYLALAERRVIVRVPRPHMVIDHMEIDAGDVSRGDPAHFEFVIKNTGDAPLTLNAHPNCGCTVANYDSTIAAGKSGKLVADVHTDNYRGAILKTIDLTTNDVDQPKATLRLGANVISIIQVLPEDIPIIPLNDDKPTVYHMTLKIRPGANVKVLEARSPTNYVQTNLQPAEENTYKLAITIGTGAPLGRSAFMINVKTDSIKEPDTMLTCICDKGILVIPDSVYLGSITPKTTLPVTGIITLMRHSGAFHITSVKSDDPKLTVKQDNTSSGQQYLLTLSYNGGWPVGAIRRKITILTDDPAQPKLEVDVVASVFPTS